MVETEDKIINCEVSFSIYTKVYNIYFFKNPFIVSSIAIIMDLN